MTSKFKTFRCKECNTVFTIKAKNNKVILCPMEHKHTTGGNVELIEG